MNALELAKKMEEVVREIFPNSFVQATFRDNLGGIISLSFGLGNGKDEWASGYLINDPAHTVLSIYDGISKEGDLGDTLVLERSIGNICLNPAPESYYAMDSHKVSYRKVKGDSTKILKGLARHFNKLKTELQSVESSIYNYNLKDKF